MTNFLKDIYNFFRLKRNEKNYSIGFFSENNFIYQYLEPYIIKKKNQHKVLIISFENLNKSYLEKKNIFVFKTKFFQELVFLTLKIKYLYSSTPDLNNNIFKKSKFSNCKYIYLSHSPVSLTLIYRENAFNNFDAVQVTNTYQFDEMREIVQNKKLKTKVFKSKYLFIKKQQEKIKLENYETDVLIAPSWNSSFYRNKCHLLLNDLFKKKKLSFKLRPHPMSYKKNEISNNELIKEGIDTDNEQVIDFQKFNFLISDWSGIFIEYSLVTRKQSFIINTPKKMLNKNYIKFKTKPIEIDLRNILGKTYEISEISKMVDEIYNFKNSSINKTNPNFQKKLDQIFY